VRRAILSAILLAAALALQLTVVNRLPLPGTGPDLVLVAVVALGLRGGPAAGALTGFCAGLGLDLAPPGSYLAGEYALVFCVIGYLCGRLRGSLNQSALLTIALAMTAAAAGEALYAAVGVVVSDPQVTWSAVRQVLPSAVIYDVAVTPFLLYGVLRAVGWADGLGRNAPGDRQADGAALLAPGPARVPRRCPQGRDGAHPAHAPAPAGRGPAGRRLARRRPANGAAGVGPARPRPPGPAAPAPAGIRVPRKRGGAAAPGAAPVSRDPADSRAAPPGRERRPRARRGPGVPGTRVRPARLGVPQPPAQRGRGLGPVPIRRSVTRPEVPA
jgi:rod shape-determining protein MreD